MKVFIQTHTYKIRSLFKMGFISLVVIISYIAFLPNYEALPEVASLSDNFNHLIAFFVLSLFLDLGFSPTSRSLVISLLMYGLFIESVQYFLPNRAFDLLDIVVDLSGIMGYILIKIGVSKR
ncbi:MAG TPA: VanZ family protein [Sulfurimonas sp.]|nr:VanZ family protein [Sulfurimonas sp.]